MFNLLSRVLLGVMLAPLAVAGAATVEVEVSNNTFTPPELNVTAGDTVRWVWVSGSHTTTSGDFEGCVPDGLWNANITVDSPSFEYTFNDVGIFPYYCIPHCASGMVGIVMVDDNSPAEDTSWGKVKWIYR